MDLGGLRWIKIACSLLFDCPSLDESCEDCVSGEYRCKDQEGILIKMN